MERIIKFRAWDKREGLHKMYHNVSFIHYGEGWTGGNPEYKFIQVFHGNGGFFLSDFNDIELLQFTGLLDSKGVEIYEKDIVLVENSLPEEKGEFDVTTICKWDNGFILEDNCGGHWTRQLLHEPERLTVIGNLFTHPELIK
jgi:uncharacterized phage protein (TIGR01671 family)